MTCFNSFFYAHTLSYRMIPTQNSSLQKCATAQARVSPSRSGAQRLV